MTKIDSNRLPLPQRQLDGSAPSPAPARNEVRKPGTSAAKSQPAATAKTPSSGTTARTSRSKPAQTDAEPTLPKGDLKTVVYAETGEKLFDHPPQLSDIDQGSIGDCFFLSSLASLAKNHPENVKNNINYVKTTVDAQGNSVNHYEVTFYKKDGNRFTPVQVPVDDELPVDRSKFAKGDIDKKYATSDLSDKRELWVSLYEKAFAKFQGGYNVIDNGGIAADAMSALTGQPADGEEILGKNPDQVFQKLQDAINQGKLTTADTWDNGTKKDDGVRWALKQMQQAGTLPMENGKPVYDPASFKYDDDDKQGENGMVAGHEYTVTGVGVDQNGVKYVELRNPWGTTEPAKWTDGVDDGAFKMPLRDFMCLYQNVYIGDVKNPADVWGLKSK